MTKTSSTTPQQVFTPQEAADFLRLKPDTLRIWRRDRRGPKHTKVGGRVRYRREDLEKYLAQQVTKSRHS